MSEAKLGGRVVTVVQLKANAAIVRTALGFHLQVKTTELQAVARRTKVLKILKM